MEWVKQLREKAGNEKKCKKKEAGKNAGPERVN